MVELVYRRDQLTEVLHRPRMACPLFDKESYQIHVTVDLDASADQPIVLHVLTGTGGPLAWLWRISRSQGNMNG
jgi:hypothetical protein